MSTRRFVIRSSEDLGRTIAEARHERGLTQAELAQDRQFDRTYLARIEAGLNTTHLERVLHVLRDLGVTVHAEMEVEDHG